MGLIDWVKAGSPKLRTKAATPFAVTELMRDPIARAMASISQAPSLDRQRIEIAQTHPIVFWCIRKISWAAASVPLQVFENDTFVPDHPASLLLADPCRGLQSASDYYRNLYAALGVTGNAYTLAVGSEVREGEIGSLQFLRPDRITPFLNGAQNEVEYFQYNTGDQTLRIAPDEVCHIRHAWINHDVYGISTLTPAWEPASIYGGIQALTRKILENSGGIPGVLVFSSQQGLSETQRDEIAANLGKFRLDGEKFGQLMTMDVGDGDVKFLALAGDIEKLQPKELQGMTADDICTLYGIPSLLRRQGEGATFSNMAEANRQLWQETIIPGYLNVVASAFSRFLGVTIKPNLHEVPALSKLATDTASVLATAGWLTTNEKRKEMGYDPLPMGDRIMTVMGQVPLDTQVVTSDAMALEMHDPKLIQALTEAYTLAALPQGAPETPVSKAARKVEKLFAKAGK